ncbi:MAG: hypothetical protein ACR5LD_02245 [Symbiopectobacterium sp.]
MVSNVAQRLDRTSHWLIEHAIFVISTPPNAMVKAPDIIPE